MRQSLFPLHDTNDTIIPEPNEYRPPSEIAYSIHNQYSHRTRYARPFVYTVRSPGKTWRRCDKQYSVFKKQ